MIGVNARTSPSASRPGKAYPRRAARRPTTVTHWGPPGVRGSRSGDWVRGGKGDKSNYAEECGRNIGLIPFSRCARQNDRVSGDGGLGTDVGPLVELSDDGRATVGPEFPGLDAGRSIAFASDLPPAAGMSSSSALMVAVSFAVADANDLWKHKAFLPELNEPLNLAGYLATMENGQSYGPLAGDRGVGTFGGSEDHTAILCARPGFVRQSPTAPCGSRGDAVAARVHVRRGRQRRGGREDGPRAGEVQPGVAAGRRRGGNLAARDRRCRAHWRRWCEAGLMRRIGCGRCWPDVPHNEFTHRDFCAVRAFPDGERTGHSRGARHWTAATWKPFGRWVDRSQQAAETLLGNQIPETIHLAASAQDRRGRSVGVRRRLRRQCLGWSRSSASTIS